MRPDDLITGESLGPRVVYVQPCEDCKLILTFTNHNLKECMREV